jgi:HD-like signal output (HDOD) protein
LLDTIFQTLFGSPKKPASTISLRQNDHEEDTHVAVAVQDPPADKDANTDVDEAPWYTPADATLIEPVPIRVANMSHEARILENVLISHFDGHDLTLPPLPRVPEAVLKTLRNSNCSFAEVADLIAEDQVVTASVLRAANSPLYGVRKVTRLPLVVTRLGAKSIRTLMMSESLRAATFVVKNGNQEFTQLLWRRSLASACIMKSLSAYIDLDCEDAFVMGLLHDVGNVIVLRIVSQHEDLLGAKVDRETFEYLCQECHQEFGELIAESWDLPPRLKEVIQNHHTYPVEGDPYRDERLILMLTNMINQMLGYGPAASYNLLQSRPVQDLGLGEDQDFLKMLDHLPKEIDYLMSCL